MLRPVADGLSNASIGEALCLSGHTVKRHVANILGKLDLPSRAAAAADLSSRELPLGRAALSPWLFGPFSGFPGNRPEQSKPAAPPISQDSRSEGHHDETPVLLWVSGTVFRGRGRGRRGGDESSSGAGHAADAAVFPRASRRGEVSRRGNRISGRLSLAQGHGPVRSCRGPEPIPVGPPRGIESRRRLRRERAPGSRQPRGTSRPGRDPGESAMRSTSPPTRTPGSGAGQRRRSCRPSGPAGTWESRGPSCPPCPGRRSAT